LRIRPNIPVCAAALLCAGVGLTAEILDRIAVSVGSQVITQSEIVTDLRVSAFLDRKPVDLSPESRRADAGRLVDQILILQEAAESHFVLPSESDAASQLAKERAEFPRTEEYAAALRSYHIREADLTAHLLAGLRALAFTELRFRPEVQISDQDLRAEYEKRVVEWRKANPAQVPSFEHSRDQLEQLMTGDREMQALDRWLAQTRMQRNVQYHEAAFQ
jgi:hypothetical protein